MMKDKKIQEVSVLKDKPKINKMSQQIINGRHFEKSPSRDEIYDRLKDGKSTVKYNFKVDN